MKKRDRWGDSDSEDDAARKSKATKSKDVKAKKKAQKEAAAAEVPLLAADSVVESAPPRAAAPTWSHVPLLHGCRSVDTYERLGHIDEGTYGVVFRARDKETGEIFALKQVKLGTAAALEGFPITALRETNILMSLRHPNIVRVKEMVVGSSVDKVYMVMEYMQHDLRAYLDHLTEPLLLSEIKCIMKQLLSALAYMHERWVIHRDLKTTNVLIDNSGRACLCDFGLARHYGSPLRNYTQMVVTRWYRSPELLLGAPTYAGAVDVWSMGCILAELLTNKPLFMGNDEAHQLDLIFQKLGTPSKKSWPDYASLPLCSAFKWRTYPGGKLREHLQLPSRPFAGIWLSECGLDLLSRMLCCDPAQRISAADALNHPWFEESPKPAQPSDMPKFPSASEPQGDTQGPSSERTPVTSSPLNGGRSDATPVAARPQQPTTVVERTPEDSWKGLFASHV